MAYVYVIRSRIDPARIHAGVSSDLEYDLARHNAGRDLTTAPHRPWETAVVLYFPEPRCASAFAAYLNTAPGRTFARHRFVADPSAPRKRTSALPSKKPPKPLAVPDQRV